jgi:hypothetical protein
VGDANTEVAGGRRYSDSFFRSWDFRPDAGAIDLPRNISAIRAAGWQHAH